MTSWLEPIRHRDYRNLWLGHFVSIVGTQMTQVAITWQVYELTDKKSPLALGALGLFKAVPMISTALAGGVIADAVDRRRLLMATQSCFLALSLILSFAAREGFTSVPLLYGVAAATGMLTALDNPARQALIPNLVPREALPRALSLSITTFNLAMVAGPAIGGLVLAGWGPAIVYAIDAASFLAVLLALLFMRYRRDASVPLTKPSLAGALDGLRFVWSVPILWSTMVIDFLATLAADCRQLMPFFATAFVASGSFGLGEKTVLGLLNAAPALGAFVTALYLTWREPPRAQGKLVLASVAVYGLAIAAFAVVDSFALGLLLLAIYGVSDTVSMVIRNVVRQEVTPDELRGRMISVNMIFFIGGPQLGELEAGLLARFVGVRASVLWGGLACTIVALAYAIRAPWLRRHVRIPTGPAPAPSLIEKGEGKKEERAPSGPAA